MFFTISILDAIPMVIIEPKSDNMKLRKWLAGLKIETE